MSLVLPRLSDPEPAPRLVPLHQPCDEVPIDKVRALWSRARFELGIREGAPAGVEAEKRLPVGGETPD